mmetsp:Transcript_3895/g.17283  ORF Transcript_3895/g.17283 Transcript_3895/m.17283 type:complete len:212 (+) Transcript_3895:4171-4806(+)
MPPPVLAKAQVVHLVHPHHHEAKVLEHGVGIGDELLGDVERVRIFVVQPGEPRHRPRELRPPPGAHLGPRLLPLLLHRRRVVRDDGEVAGDAELVPRLGHVPRELTRGIGADLLHLAAAQVSDHGDVGGVAQEPAVHHRAVRGAPVGLHRRHLKVLDVGHVLAVLLERGEHSCAPRRGRRGGCGRHGRGVNELERDAGNAVQGALHRLYLT